MGRIPAKLRSFCYWLWQQCRDWRTLALLGLVVVAMYSPVWGGYLLRLLLGWKWAGALATAVLVFWAGPMTPFFPLCVAITLAIKRFCQKRGKEKK